MLRCLLCALLGTVLAIAVIAGIEAAAHALWPAPSAAAVTLPMQLAVLAGWTLGALVGASAAVALSRRAWPGWIAGGIVALAVLANVVLIPHPIWMTVIGLAAPILMALLAGVLFARPPSQMPGAAA